MEHTASVPPTAEHDTNRTPVFQRDDPNFIAYARQFWKLHNLKRHVTEADFVKGALYFRYPNASITTVGANGIQSTINISGDLPLDDTSLTLKPPSPAGDELDLSLTHLDRLSLNKFRKKGRRDKWKNLSNAHRLLLISCAVASITQGWDQSSMNGANLGWPKSLGLALEDNVTQNPGDRHVWWFGFVNGIPFLSGAFVGPIFADILIKWRLGRRTGLGRRGVLLVAGAFSFAAMLGSAFVKRWEELLVCRLLLGIGMASKATIVPILLSETSPTEIRGMAVTLWQLFVSFGILLGFAANLLVSKFDHLNNWKYMFAAAAIPPSLLFITVPFCEESPRWLLKEQHPNHVYKALSALLSLHNLPSPIVACGDLLLMHESLYEETQWLIENSKKKKKQQQSDLVKGHPESPISHDPANGTGTTNDTGKTNRCSTTSGTIVAARIDDDSILPANATDGQPTRSQHLQITRSQSDAPDVIVHCIEQAGWLTRWRLMLATQRMRTAVYAAMAVMISQQACGINLFAFLSSTFYLDTVVPRKNGTIEEPPLLQHQVDDLSLGLGFGIVNFLFSLAAFLFIDWKKPNESANNSRIVRMMPETINRRSLLNISFPFMFIFLLIAGLVLTGTSEERPPTTVIVVYYVFLYLFTAAYSIGEGPMAFLISSEVFPLVNREIGMSVAVLFNFLGAFMISLFAPILKKEMTQTGLLVTFACFNILSWIACHVLVPNTQGQNLEVINEELETSLAELIEFRWSVFTCRFSRTRKLRDHPPLHRFVVDMRQRRSKEAIKNFDGMKVME